MGKIKDFFSEIGDKVKTSVRIPKDAPFYYLSLVLIFILAVLIRLSPVITGTFLIKAFDPWMQYDSTKYLIEHGWYDWLHYHDYKMWYPEGTDRWILRPGLLFTNALLYYVLNALGIHVTVFQVVFYFPAFMGGITVLVMYSLGKEILDRRAGILAAFFLAVSPGYMQRTVAGFYDNETIGVFGVLMVFLFFVKAVKSGKISHSFIAGLSLGYLALSWGGMTFPFLLIPLLTLILILADKYNAKVMLAYAVTIGVGELIYTLNPFFEWFRMVKEMEFIFPILFMGFLVIYHMLYLKKSTKTYDQILSAIKWASIPIGIAAAIIFWQKPEWIPFNLASRLESILNPNIREDIHLVASVGEHMPSPWSVFYYNTLIALLLVVPGIYFAIKRSNIEDLLMVIFVVTLFYFTGSMIRIILLFAPAVALIGGYGLSFILKFFGNLMKKKSDISRRRKRQLKRTIGRPEGIVVYIFVGVLLFVQVNHATTISSQQMGYSELVAGGVYPDWEEALTWMKYNLPYTSVVVSWWDYGYWITIIGNATSVNDNGTWNNTRIGLTGMAFMQTNERYSAEIFKMLKADYVLVYFGHLYNGLGGDEGKWPWMLRICNDHTEQYKAMGLERDNWYGNDKTADTVFVEDEYINSTSGLYEDKWFESTLVKLMFANEPTTISAAKTQTQAFYASEIEGSQQYNKEPRKDDNGKLWSDHIPTNGQYDFQFFTPAYYSQNSLVKIYKIDYTALDSSFEIKDQYLDTNGYGFANVQNTGNHDIDISSVKINGIGYNFTIQNSNTTIAPNESRYLVFDATEHGLSWNLENTYNITIDTSVTKTDGSKLTITNSSVDTQVTEPKNASIFIDRSASKFELLENDQTQALINVKNTGEIPVLLNNITINDLPVNKTDIFNDETNNFVIAPGQNETFLAASLFAPPADLNYDANVTVGTSVGAVDTTSIPYNKPGFHLSIQPGDLETLPEDEYRFDYSNYEPINTQEPRLFLNYNTDTYLLENGTLQITVKNDGEKVIGFQRVYVNDELVNFTVVGGDYFPNPGETRIIRATVNNVERNTPVKVFVTGENEGTCASDGIYLVPRNETKMIDIINSTDSSTAAFANETLRLVVKNTGSSDVELSQITINNTINVAITANMVSTNSTTLKPSEVVEIQTPFTGLNVNLTDIVNVKVSTTTPYAFSTRDLEAILPTRNNLIGIVAWNGTKPGHANYAKTYADESDNHVHLMFSVFLNSSVTIDSVMIKSDTGDYEYVPYGTVSLTDNDGNSIDDNVVVGAETTADPFALYYIDFNTDGIGGNINFPLIRDQTIYVKIRTIEGYEVETEIVVQL